MAFEQRAEVMLLLGAVLFAEVGLQELALEAELNRARRRVVEPVATRWVQVLADPHHSLLSVQCSATGEHIREVDRGLFQDREWDSGTGAFLAKMEQWDSMTESVLDLSHSVEPSWSLSRLAGESARPRVWARNVSLQDFLRVLMRRSDPLLPYRQAMA